MNFIKYLMMSNFIKEFRFYLLTNKVFINEDDLEYFFLNGGCFIFARICKRIFPKAIFMINNTKQHCVIKYGEKLFDIRGAIIEKNFKIVSDDDYLYMDKNFGHKDLSKEFEIKFIDDINICFKHNEKPPYNFTITHNNI